MKKILLVLSLLWFCGCGPDYINPEQVPPIVKEAFAKQYPNIKAHGWTVETESSKHFAFTFYTAYYWSADEECLYDARFSPSGEYLGGGEYLCREYPT